jgi:hypothetical protein
MIDEQVTELEESLTAVGAAARRYRIQVSIVIEKEQFHDRGW